MADPKCTFEPLPYFYGGMTAYLVKVDGETIGRVISERINAKVTLWTARDVDGKEIALTETRKDAAKRLSDHHKRQKETQ